MKLFIIKERETNKTIKTFTDENKAYNEMRKMAKIKKEQNEKDWDFYKLVIKR